MRGGRRVLASLTAVALVSGCGGDPDDRSSAGEAAGGGEAFDEPVVISDCNGFESTVEQPPERVVTLTSPVLEMLFWLGVQDRVIGTGSPPGPGDLPEQFEAESMEVPRLAGEYESGAFQPVPREVLIGNTPDFVIGGFSSNFDAEGAASQEELADRGIPSYLTYSLSCPSAQDGPVEDLQSTYRDLENLGAVFGVEERATELVDEMEATVAAAQEQIEGVDERPTVFAFEYDEGTESPYATGNQQTINAVISLAGGQNVFADLDTDYERVGWEEVIARDPDVILIITYAEGDPEADEAGRQEAEEFLTTFEPIQGLDVVREQRFAHLLYEEASAGGVRNAQAVADLVGQVHPGVGQ